MDFYFVFILFFKFFQMATRASGRLTKEMNDILSDNQKNNNILYYVDPDNMFNWYFMIHNIPISDKLNDCYFIGKMMFTQNYPFEAPSIRMLTPTGIVTPDRNICISGLSSFHSESWSPLNTGTTIAFAFVSVMLESTTSGIGWIDFHKTNKIIEEKLIEHSLKSKLYNERHNKRIQDMFLEFLNS
jgi:ubiquitin-protein ligase